jgi:hypothetical protein
VKEFVTAVKDAASQEDEDGAIVFMHNGQECVFYQPSEGQFLMMMSMGGRSMGKNSIGNFIHLFIEMGDDDTQRYFRDIMMDRNSGFTITGEGGMFDIWEHLVEEWSGKDSEQPTVSPRRPSETGRVSTVRSRRSISSVSPSGES